LSRFCFHSGFRSPPSSTTSRLTVKRVSDRKYVLINKVAAQFFDVPLDQQLGRTAEEIFPPDVAEVINKNDAEALTKSGSEPTTG
jgi:PAS fold